MNNKVIVFGGTGDVGQVIVQKLLDKGELVSVLTRTPREDKMSLNYVLGNVLDFEIVEKAIEEGDKIIIALGLNNSSWDTMSKGTENIIRAMKKNGATRLVCLSAQGAGDSWDYMPDEFKEMVLGNEILSASFKDHGIQEDIVKHSNLEWTIVRPTEIIDEMEKGTFTVNKPNHNSTYQISKYDVAEFIVNELTDKKYIKQTVMITD